MKNDWAKFPLADICVLITKGTTPTTLGYNFAERGVNFIKSESITFDGRIDKSKFAFIDEATHQGLSRSMMAEGDILFSMAGVYIGKTAVVTKELLPANSNQAVGIIRVDRTKAEPRFIDYYIRNKSYNLFLNNLVSQSAQPNFNLTQIRTLPISLPPLHEQRAVASILGSLDDKIELNRRMNETLEALAQILFKTWFIDPTRNGLPKGWRYATMAELSEINSWTLGKEDELGRIDYVEISEVMRGNIGKVQTYNRGEEPSRARRRLRHGDTVLSTVRPDRGAFFLCLNPRPTLIASTGFAVLTPTKAPWSFIHAAMTQADVFEYLGQQADGGAYPAVRPEIIGQLEVPWPNKPNTVEEFHRACAPLFERAELNRHESHTLAALRDALLPKFMSGELRSKRDWDVQPV